MNTGKQDSNRGWNWMVALLELEGQKISDGKLKTMRTVLLPILMVWIQMWWKKMNPHPDRKLQL
ncbi:hypothetical protein J6590_067035 [Homalodisca vitripennis]|nr:hypothetical protein J6590_067035 [Homalodisca vitripennis]